MKQRVSREESLQQLRSLLAEQRWAALATSGNEGEPEASMVAYVLTEDGAGLYLHLSELAAHTRNLMRSAQASLAVSEKDSGGDPQQLQRATLFGHVEALERDSEAYATARERYLARLPDAAMLFDFSDFHLFRMEITRVRFTGGFAQAYSYEGSELTA